MISEVNSNKNKLDFEVATIGGGCFWCLEAVFEQLNGVTRVISGYSGGSVSNPTYEQVCSGRTGHAEVVQITFDPRLLSYKELLQVFFSIHDPTTLNRQGHDVGSQYRSVIYFQNDDQKIQAENIMKEIEIEQVWNDPIVTEVAPLEAFYPAEEYHQEYFRNHPDQTYCQVVISPKVVKFRKQFLDRLKEQPSTV